MQQLSLGLIETSGLLSAVTAADAAVKSANVTLIGYELAKGSGMTTVKIEGDVAAVKAAISAAEYSVKAVGRVVSTSVIARPAQDLSIMTRSKDTVRADLSTPQVTLENPARHADDELAQKSTPEDAKTLPAESNMQDAQTEEIHGKDIKEKSNVALDSSTMKGYEEEKHDE